MAYIMDFHWNKYKNQLFLAVREFLKKRPEQTWCDRDRTLSLILGIATDNVSYSTADQAVALQQKV